MVSDHKGINLPGVAVSVPALSEKDIDDLRWGLRLGADLIALSFVRSADDVERRPRIMDEEGVRLPVLAKIEKPQAVENLEEIVEAFDGIMVARGDLGVELPAGARPAGAEARDRAGREAAKPVIVATQMLESMIGASRPTRAEASDVANAVLDGADALMLSGETSRRAATRSSRCGTMAPHHHAGRGARRSTSCRTVADRTHSKAGAICQRRGRRRRDRRRQLPRGVHRDRRARRGGWPGTVRRSRCWRSRPNRGVRSQLALSWGVETFLSPPVEHTDEMVRQVDSALLDIDRVQGRRAGRHRRRRRPRASRARPTRCASTGWAATSPAESDPRLLASKALRLRRLGELPGLDPSPSPARPVLAPSASDAGQVRLNSVAPVRHAVRTGVACTMPVGTR